MAGKGPGKRPPRPGGATANGSLYERYKDALRRGHVAALRGRHEAAIDAYGEAATIAPDRALPHASIGGILAKMGRLDDAVAAYDRALALAPRDETSLRGLADVHVREGRRTDAADTLDRLAETLEGGGRLADATDAARRAFELAGSQDRRVLVEGLADRLRTTSSGDEAAQRALDQALRVLEPPAAEVEPVAEEPAPEPEPEAAAASEAEPEAAPETGPEAAPEPGPEIGDGASEEPEAAAEVVEPGPEPEELAAEPVGLGIALGAAAESALHAGNVAAAHDGLLAAARAHRRAGRLSAAVDACYLAIGNAPSDPELHILLAELYLDRGWRSLAVEKMLLLGRLADLDDDRAVRERLCALATERLADEPRVADLCA